MSSYIDAITAKLFWFPAMWRLKHERANSIPPYINTGLGPDGNYTTFYQVPPPGHTAAGAGATTVPPGAGTNIDPVLLDYDARNPAPDPIAPAASSSQPPRTDTGHNITHFWDSGLNLGMSADGDSTVLILLPLHRRRRLPRRPYPAALSL